MIGSCSCVQNGIDHLDGVVAAIMINNDEIIVLHSLHQPLHIGGGELFRQGRGQKPRHRLRQDDSVCTGLFVRLAVLYQKRRGLLHHQMHHVRLVIAFHHDLRHVQKPGSQ